jgi:hypothetical protein
MTNLERIVATGQAASEKLFHIIVEAHEAGRSPCENPAFAECVTIVQGAAIASTVASKFDAPSPGRPEEQASQGSGSAFPAGAIHEGIAGPSDSSASPAGESVREPHLEGTSFQVNANTLKEGDDMKGEA